MKTRTILFLGLGLVFARVASLLLPMHRSIQSRIGPEHVFSLTEHPESLTEDFASRASETGNRISDERGASVNLP
jgi:hypothetical protein